MTQIETTTTQRKLNDRQASWLFLPQGLIMPARVPNGGKEGTADPKFTHDGLFQIQVRARSEQHLKNVIRDYFEPLGLPYSEIQLTPKMDYNARFYTTHEALGQFYMQVALDTDSLKFKPLAEDKRQDGSYRYGTESQAHTYHSVLNSIWGTVTRIGAPGGFYGGYGYGSTSRSSKGGKVSFTSRVGDSFGERSLADEVGLDGRYDDKTPMWDEDFDSYTPKSARRAETIIRDMAGVPVDEWPDFLTAAELETVNDYVAPDGSLNKKGQRELARENRKTNKSVRPRYKRERSRKH